MFGGRHVGAAHGSLTTVKCSLMPRRGFPPHPSTPKARGQWAHRHSVSHLPVGHPFPNLFPPKDTWPLAHWDGLAEEPPVGITAALTCSDSFREVFRAPSLSLSRKRTVFAAGGFLTSWPVPCSLRVLVPPKKSCAWVKGSQWKSFL